MANAPLIVAMDLNFMEDYDPKERKTDEGSDTSSETSGKISPGLDDIRAGAGTPASDTSSRSSMGSPSSTPTSDRSSTGSLSPTSRTPSPTNSDKDEQETKFFGKTPTISEGYITKPIAKEKYKTPTASTEATKENKINAVLASITDKSTYTDFVNKMWEQKLHTTYTSGLYAQDINISNAMGMTPLMIAAERGNAALVKALLKAGADKNAKDGSNRTAARIALENKHGIKNNNYNVVILLDPTLVKAALVNKIKSSQGAGKEKELVGLGTYEGDFVVVDHDDF